MNQKYLQGLSSDMSGPGDAVCFEATPENISAFLMRHQGAVMSAIGTMDSRSFLTARMGFIDICPDQKYLREKLLPVYSRVQMGELPVPELRSVSKEVALAAERPRPDWNYLRWKGYSDTKYQAVFSGEALLELTWDDKKLSLELQVRPYYNAGKLALLMVDWTNGEPEHWGDLTVNFGASTAKDCAFVDVNKLGENILSWIEKNGLGKPTGRKERSGFVEYPEYHFDAKRLQELDDYGYHEYSRIFDQANRGQHSQRTDGRER